MHPLKSDCFSQFEHIFVHSDRILYTDPDLQLDNKILLYLAAILCIFQGISVHIIHIHNRISFGNLQLLLLSFSAFLHSDLARFLRTLPMQFFPFQEQHLLSSSLFLFSRHHLHLQRSLPNDLTREIQPTNHTNESFQMSLYSYRVRIRKTVFEKLSKMLSRGRNP